jgi:RNA polymerase sigma factor (sigma-70 family)
MNEETSLTASDDPKDIALEITCPEGERNIADEIYVQHAPLLRRIAVRKFGVPPGDAEALVHDVFVNCLLTARNIRGDLRAYLIAAICNACRNYWRTRRSEQRVFADDDTAAADVIADDLFDGLALNLVVASTLAKLGPRCRELLRRYYLNGEETAAIAAAMNTTPANVNYLMHVCRKHARVVYDAITRVP